MTAQSPRPSSRSAIISRREPSGGISTSSMSNSTSTSNARGVRVRRFPRSRASFRMLSSSLAHNEGLVWSLLDDKADHSPPLQTRGLNSDTCPRQTPAGSSPEPHPTATLPSSIPSSLTHPIDLTPFDTTQDLSSVPDPHYPVQPTSGHDTFLTHQDTFERATSIPDFKIRLPTDQELQNPSVDLQDMSTLGFMLPPQYGSMDAYGSSAQVESSYLMDQPDRKSSVSGPPFPQSSGPGSYAPSYTASPQLLGSSPMIGTERRASGPRTDQLQSYAAQVPRSPYQSPHGSVRASPVPMAAYQTSSVDGPSIGTPPQAHAYPALQPAVGGHNMTALGYIPGYPAQYAPGSYDQSYAPLPHSMYHGAHNASYPPPYIPSSMMEQQQSAASANGGNVRVINSRPKPQCWEHGCNGRQFSTFSNLLRHQREKSGTATKSSCPRCGAEFTRTTARNGHMAHDKCKPRRASESN